MSQTDPNRPEYWSSRYEKDDTPWDLGGVPLALKDFLRVHRNEGKVLIPGCGNGHEIAAFAAAGYEVTAMDFSPTAVERAKKAVGPELAGSIILGDFFTHSFVRGEFDLVYERTFLCALLPRRRVEYRDRMAYLLKHTGILAGLFYYQDTPVGPPFGFAWGESDALFSHHFLLIRDVQVKDSLPMFTGRERWQERRRTAFNASRTPFSDSAQATASADSAARS